MPDLDLLILGAHPLPAIGITNGRIVSHTEGEALETIDASGMLVLPGLVDAHTHFNDPGRAHWEGWETGSQSALAGGITTVGDMPLNSTPPVVTVEAFDAKVAAALHRAHCDFALWGGLVPGHLDDLPRLAERGVFGFKAFLSHSGIDDFAKADLATLKAGLRIAAKLGLPVAVHAELDEENTPSGPTVRSYLDSRPIASECEAVQAALDLAGEAGCALHIVHVSSAAALDLIAQAKARGQDVTAETCPHYLVFTGEDMERLGAVAKCAPPMRDEANRLLLWQKLRAGLVDTLGSDHSPSPWKLKEDKDFSKVWGGISGIQHLLPVLLDEGLEPELLATLAALHPARRFRFPGKGSLAIGSDADLVLVEKGPPHRLTQDQLFYHHPHSPYVGRKFSHQVVRTILRGRTVFFEGTFLEDAKGRLVVPKATVQTSRALI